MYVATRVDARRTILQGFLTLSSAHLKKRIRANRRSLNADRLGRELHLKSSWLRRKAMKLMLLPVVLAIGCASLAHAALPLTLDVAAQDHSTLSWSASDFAARIPYSGQFTATGMQDSLFTKSSAHRDRITISESSPELQQKQGVRASKSVESASTSIPEENTMLLFVAGILLTGTLRLRIINS
jgi:hypothetical protein